MDSRFRYGWMSVTGSKYFVSESGYYLIYLLDKNVTHPSKGMSLGLDPDLFRP